MLINGNPLESDINNLDRRLSIDFNALGPYPENTHTKLKDKENYTQENTGIKSKFIYNDSHEYWFTSASDHDHISHDIEQQTIQTLKNIFTLKEKYKVEPNIQDHCKFIKVKIKNSEDCKTVEELIKGLLPNVETVITCPALNQHHNLVEMEGLISY